MYAWEAIQKTLDYIEDHLTEEIGIRDLCDLAALSPFYYQRLFSRLVKKPVGEYLKLRRLANAAQLLVKDDGRILDTALAFGFSSHASFTRAFRETFGVTPEEFRAGKVKLNYFVKPDLVLNYVMVEENIPLITDGMVLEISRRTLETPRTFLGIEGFIPIDQLMGGKTSGVAEAAKLWDRLHELKPQIPNLLPGGNEFGALYIGDAPEGSCTYLAAAEIKSETGEQGFTAFRLPAGDYLVTGFESPTQAELFESALYKADEFTDRWMSERGLTAGGGFAAELYFDPTPEAAYLEHWVLPEPLEN